MTSDADKPDPGGASNPPGSALALVRVKPIYPPALIMDPYASARRRKNRRLDLDLLFALLLFLGLALLGLMFVPVRKPVDDARRTQVATAPKRPAIPPPEVAPAPKPLPAGPFDLRPKTDLALAAPAPAPPATPAAPPAAVSKPERLATAASTPPAAVADAAKPPLVTPPPPGRSCPDTPVLQVYFCTDQAQLLEEPAKQLREKIRNWAGCFPGHELAVHGYADTQGDPDLNTWLSERRAEGVAKILREETFKVAIVRGEGELAGLPDQLPCSNQRRVDIGPADSPLRTDAGCVRPLESTPPVCPPKAPPIPVDPALLAVPARGGEIGATPPGPTH